jgi:hypothetical protein
MRNVDRWIQRSEASDLSDEDLDQIWFDSVENAEGLPEREGLELPDHVELVAGLALTALDAR